ncbi:MAG: hypothetical protein R3E34_08120 [Rhodocyclaceae bacterium]
MAYTGKNWTLGGQPKRSNTCRQKTAVGAQIFPTRRKRPRPHLRQTDSHADDIIQLVRQVPARATPSAKVTYRAEEDPDNILASFATTTTRASPLPST